MVRGGRILLRFVNGEKKRLKGRKAISRRKGFFRAVPLPFDVFEKEIAFMAGVAL